MILGDGLQVIWNGRNLGFFSEDIGGLAFITPRDESHKFRMYDSWGMNKDLVIELQEVGVKRIKVVVDGGKKVLISTPSHWIERGIEYKARDFELQIQLREKDFDKVFV